jgi:lauroyl/myristoyl acyltransferase
MGSLMPLVVPKRQALLMDNLRLAFPEESEKSLRRTAAISRARTIEIGLFSFALPLLSERRLRAWLSVSDDMKKAIDEKKDGSVLLLVPHLCLTETFCCLPLLVQPAKTIGAVFRPLRNLRLGEWLRRGRERFGMVALSRGKGLLPAARFLKKGQVCGMLFDQNAGHAGTRMKFLGRECSCTTLPDILAKRFQPEIVIAFPRRTGFWQAVIECETMVVDSEKESVAQKAHAWLEGKLREDLEFRENWLWSHNRWKEGSGKSGKQTDVS